MIGDKCFVWMLIGESRGGGGGSVEEGTSTTAVYVGISGGAA